MLIQSELALLESLLYRLVDRVQAKKYVLEFVKDTGLSNVEQLAGVYAVSSMTSYALFNKKPLPTITPGRLAERYRRKVMSRIRDQIVSTSGTEEYFKNSDGRLLLASVVVSNLLYERFDIIMILVKVLVGETYDTDLRVCDGVADSTVPDFSEHSELLEAEQLRSA